MFTYDEARAYLAAMIDGEGYISLTQDRQGRMVAIVNTDSDIIEAIIEASNVVDLPYRIYYPPRQKENYLQQTKISFYGEPQLKKIRDIIPIRSRRKVDILDKCLQAYKDTRESHRIPVELLIEYYYKEGLTGEEIATRLDVIPQTVRKWMKRVGLVTYTKVRSDWQEKRLELYNQIYPRQEELIEKGNRFRLPKIQSQERRI